MCLLTLSLSGHSALSELDGCVAAGGRASSRPVDGYTFDHAAQFIVARDAAFAPVLQRWLADGVVQPWEGRFGLLECSDTTMRFVPTGMSHTNSEEPG
jgi:predicted NAD/FAD-dependent oxidoreductase